MGDLNAVGNASVGARPAVLQAEHSVCGHKAHGADTLHACQAAGNLDLRARAGEDLTSYSGRDIVQTLDQDILEYVLVAIDH